MTFCLWGADIFLAKCPSCLLLRPSHCNSPILFLHKLAKIQTLLVYYHTIRITDVVTLKSGVTKNGMFVMVRIKKECGIYRVGFKGVQIFPSLHPQYLGLCVCVPECLYTSLLSLACATFSAARPCCVLFCAFAIPVPHIPFQVQQVSCSTLHHTSHNMSAKEIPGISNTLRPDISPLILTKYLHFLPDVFLWNENYCSRIRQDHEWSLKKTSTRTWFMEKKRIAPLL